MEEPLTATDDEGFIYDPVTGEVIGHEIEDSQEEVFRVDTRERAEWVLEKLMRLDAAWLAIEMRQKAIGKNILRQQGEINRRIAWWELRFRSELIEFSKTLFTKKTKTAVFDHGIVSIRENKGNNKIIDREAAVAYVKKWAPELIKIVPAEESVGVTEVIAARAIEQTFLELETEPSLGFLVSSGPNEQAKIDTRLNPRKED